MVYRHYTPVYCDCLSVVLVAFRFGCNLALWLPCLERASYSALMNVVGKGFVVQYVLFHPPGVYVGTLNLFASIPGPSILTSV